MRLYSVADILAWHPCERYTEQSLGEMFGRRKSVSLIEILSADISDDDAIWAACHAMDERQRRLFACECAESVLHLANDPRSTEAVRVARLYAYGMATDAELDAAWAAARDAAWAAAGAAAGASAWDAAWAAAGAAARAADRAAWDAAWDAGADAWDAAWDAARAAAGAAWDAAWDAGADAWDAAWDAARAAAGAAWDAAWDAARAAARQALLMLALAGEIE